MRETKSCRTKCIKQTQRKFRHHSPTQHHVGIVGFFHYFLSCAVQCLQFFLLNASETMNYSPVVFRTFIAVKHNWDAVRTCLHVLEIVPGTTRQTNTTTTIHFTRICKNVYIVCVYKQWAMGRRHQTISSTNAHCSYLVLIWVAPECVCVWMCVVSIEF